MISGSDSLDDENGLFVTVFAGVGVGTVEMNLMGLGLGKLK